MGYPRPRPTHLAEKLLQIRLSLKISQPKLAKRFGDAIPYTNISKYERNVIEPPLAVLLLYSRAVQIPVKESLTMTWICSTSKIYTLPENCLTDSRLAREPNDFRGFSGKASKTGFARKV